MKAVIMAGGEGRRLRPLTAGHPKALARLCGKPVLGILLELLERSGVEECILSLCAGAHEIEAFCKSRPQKGMKLTCQAEPYPLGTAGGVRHALRGRMEEPVLVLSGDALCDFRLGDLAQGHIASGAAVTILTARVEDPREYGLVRADASGYVKGFVEKPAFSQAAGGEANTGIYFLSPEALHHIPEGKTYDFASQLFPELLRQGSAMRAVTPDGYWRDIGSLRDYRAAQRDLMEGRVNVPGFPLLEACPEGVHYTIRQPAWIGSCVQIGDGAFIGPGSVLDNGCCVGAGARVEGGILLPRAALGAGARISDAILCEAARVGAGAVLEEGAAVGARATIGRDAHVGRGVRVAPGARVADRETVFSHRESGRTSAASFGDSGLEGEAGIDLTPDLAVRTGCAVGSLAKGKAVGVAHAGPRCHSVLADALIAGIRSTGTPVLDFGAAFEPLFQFGMRSNALQLGVYIDAGVQDAVRVVCEGGLPAARPVEREIEQRLANGDFFRARPDAYGDRINLAGIGTLYAAELLRLAPEGLEGMEAAVRCQDVPARRMLEETLRRLGCVLSGEGVVLHLSRGGARVSLEQGGVRIGWRRAVAAYGRILFEQGEDLALDSEFPQAAEGFAQKWGRRVYRYLLCPADASDAPGRALALRQHSRDGLMLSILLLRELRRRKLTLAALERELPVFAVEEGEAVCPAKSLSNLQGEAAGEGILLRGERGVVLLRPRKNGKSLRVLAEAANWETAKELCGDVVSRIQELSQKGMPMQSGDPLLDKWTKKR